MLTTRKPAWSLSRSTFREFIPMYSISHCCWVNLEAKSRPGHGFVYGTEYETLSAAFYNNLVGCYRLAEGREMLEEMDVWSSSFTVLLARMNKLTLTLLVMRVLRRGAISLSRAPMGLHLSAYGRLAENCISSALINSANPATRPRWRRGLQLPRLRRKGEICFSRGLNMSMYH